MSDLHRAIQDRAEDFAPALTPPFSALRSRKRRRDQRRTGAAVVLVVLAVLSVAVGPSAFGLLVPKGSEAGQVAGAEHTYRFTVGFPSAQANLRSQDKALNRRCYTLPGVTQAPLPPTDVPNLGGPSASGRVSGTDQADALRNCVERVVPGSQIFFTDATTGGAVAVVARADRHRLLVLADQVASNNSGKAVDVAVVRTSLRQAGSAGSTNRPDQAVWVLQESGDTYVCRDCTSPSNARPPHGRYLTQVLTVGDLQTLSGGISPNVRDLSALGQVAVLRGHPTARSSDCIVSGSPSLGCLVPETGPKTFSVFYNGGVGHREEDAAIRSCLGLPGVVRQDTLHSDPQIYSATVAGPLEIQAFRNCINNLQDVTLREAAATTPSPTPSGLANISLCGSGVVHAVLSNNSTVPLASCAGTVGGSTLRTVHLPVGDHLDIKGSGGPDLVITSTDPSIAKVDGTRVEAVAPGQVDIVLESGAFCSPPSNPVEGPQPKRCAMLSIKVDP